MESVARREDELLRITGTASALARSAPPEGASGEIEGELLGFSGSDGIGDAFL
jgi:hypothetical protein